MHITSQNDAKSDFHEAFVMKRIATRSNMHIESALSGVPENQRCAGYKTGTCPPKQEFCKISSTSSQAK